jgi:hypothetical protein
LFLLEYAVKSNAWPRGKRGFAFRERRECGLIEARNAHAVPDVARRAPDLRALPNEVLSKFQRRQTASESKIDVATSPLTPFAAWLPFSSRFGGPDHDSDP